MNRIPINLDLLLVPASVVAKLVELKQPISSLSNADALRRILTTDALYFYKAINLDIKSFVPDGLINTFNCGSELLNTNGFDNISDSECLMYMTTLPSDKLALLELIADMGKYNPEQYSSIQDNNYVGQFFAIDEKTIGVIPTLSQNPKADMVDSMRNLLSMINDDYLLQRIETTTTDNRDARIRTLASSGLLTMYCNLTHQ